MKTKLLNALLSATLFLIPAIHFAQAPNIGAAANFVLFSSNGAVTNNTSSFSQVTGDVGNGNPAKTSTGFGNINGTHHDGDTKGIAAKADLLSAYNKLDSMSPNFTISPLLGNGDTLVEGIYFVPSSNPATLDLNLFLDAEGDSGALFVFQIEGPFSTHTNSKIILINGAKACNVFWKVEGLVDMETGTTMRGNVIANNAAIKMQTGDTLEGRALSTTGAITINGVFAYIPLGCGTPILTGPTTPVLGSVECFGLFSSTGAVSNSGTTMVNGDVGSNSMSPTGFVASDVTGSIHANPDAATLQCKNDLALVYTYLDNLPVDIELKFPAAFGHHLVLTPHTYHLNAATTLIDTIVLNAQGNVNGVFVLKINGALTTMAKSKVKLINGAQSKNVFWKIEGGLDMGTNTVFVGTVIVNNGALGSMGTGTVLNGRALTTSGALSTTAISTTMAAVCPPVGISSYDEKITKTATIYPNPFGTSFHIQLIDTWKINNTQLIVYNVLGEVMLFTTITKQLTIIETENLQTGVYFYQLVENSNVIQSGRLAATQ